MTNSETTVLRELRTPPAHVPVTTSCQNHKCRERLRATGLTVERDNIESRLATRMLLHDVGIVGTGDVLSKPYDFMSRSDGFRGVRQDDARPRALHGMPVMGERF